MWYPERARRIETLKEVVAGASSCEVVPEPVKYTQSLTGPATVLTPICTTKYCHALVQSSSVWSCEQCDEGKNIPLRMTNFIRIETWQAIFFSLVYKKAFNPRFSRCSPKSITTYQADLAKHILLDPFKSSSLLSTRLFRYTTQNEAHHCICPVASHCFGESTSYFRPV